MLSQAPLSEGFFRIASSDLSKFAIISWYKASFRILTSSILPWSNFGFIRFSKYGGIKIKPRITITMGIITYKSFFIDIALLTNYYFLFLLLIHLSELFYLLTFHIRL